MNYYHEIEQMVTFSLDKILPVSELNTVIANEEISIFVIAEPEKYKNEGEAMSIIRTIGVA